jgi:hypothetical protein
MFRGIRAASGGLIWVRAPFRIPAKANPLSGGPRRGWWNLVEMTPKLAEIRLFQEFLQSPILRNCRVG